MRTAPETTEEVEPLQGLEGQVWGCCPEQPAGTYALGREKAEERAGMGRLVAQIVKKREMGFSRMWRYGNPVPRS